MILRYRPITRGRIQLGQADMRDDTYLAMVQPDLSIHIHQVTDVLVDIVKNSMLVTHAGL